MFICFICSLKFLSCYDIIKHLHIIHSLYDNSNLFLKCGMPNCCHSFNTFSGLRKHLNKHELEASQCPNNKNTPKNLQETFNYAHLESVSSNVNEIRNNSYDEFDNSDSSNDNVSDKIFDPNIEITNILKLFVSQLMALSLTNPQNQIIIQSVNELMEDIFNLINKTNFVEINIKHMAYKIKCEVQKYDSFYKRNKFVNSFEFVKPKDILIGMRSENILAKGANTYKEPSLPC